MKEGSGAGSGSGSIPLKNGSGSEMPKNMLIRWIRIRNTVSVGNHTRIFLCRGIRFQMAVLQAIDQLDAVEAQQPAGDPGAAPAHGHRRQEPAL
jgi:hypothetical protein